MLFVELLSSYTHLHDNRTTSYKVRELKSVSVDTVGQYLRLVMDKNHVNKFNLFNQVCNMIQNQSVSSFISFSTSQLDEP